LVGWHALGQEALQPPVPPPLPETVVEGTPEPTPAPQPFFPPQPQPELPSLLEGTIFDSPSPDGYLADSATTGAIVDTPLSSLPFSVGVVPRATLDDQIALRMEDVIRNTGGVTRAGDGVFADRIFLRGLEVGSRNFRKDGFLDPTYVPRDFQNVERVEILKGPSSVLYGTGDPAGVVNVITKKPLNDTFAVLGYTFGSYSRSRYTLDANGIVNQSGNLLYRLNVAQEDANSFVDFDNLSRTQIAPVLTWLLDDQTTLTWSGEWHRHNTLGFQGAPAINGDPLYLPPNRFVGEPANDFYHLEEFRQSLVLRHQVNEDWWWSVGGYSLFYNFRGSTTGSAAQVNPVPPIIVRSRTDFPVEDEQSQSAIANLAGRFWTGNWTHNSVVGMEYNYFDSKAIFNSSVIADPFFVDTSTYTNPAAAPVFSASFPVFRQQRFGAYAQDLIEFNPYLIGLAALRLDACDFEFQRNIGFGNFETQEQFNRTTTRLGLVYRPTGDDVWNFYYSYATSFTPPGGGIYLNNNLQPILGEAHEIGLKTEVLEDLWLTAAAFHITRQNDAFNVQSIVLTQIGQVRSQGVELNLIGNLTDNWSVIANYTYTDTLLTDPDPAFNGRLARNVPYNSANLWTRYKLWANDVDTFGAALGCVYLGQRAADLSNTLFLPAYTRWDAGVYYQRGRWNASVYLENLFDIQYAAASANVNQINQGAPFNTRATISFLY